MNNGLFDCKSINNLTIFINRAPRFVNNKYTDVNYSLQIPFCCSYG